VFTYGAARDGVVATGVDWNQSGDVPRVGVLNDGKNGNLGALMISGINVD
jgi:hypothetical protein